MDINLYGFICWLLGFATCWIYFKFIKKNGKTK